MNNKQRIEKQIKHIELQLARLNQQVCKNEVCDDITNSLILQKAILKDVVYVDKLQITKFATLVWMKLEINLLFVLYKTQKMHLL